MSEPTRRITVVAAVVVDDRGRVLIARRPDGGHMAGLWEFPGGKVRPDESPAMALAREIREELGVELAIVEPLTFAVHTEPGLEILLLFFRAAIRRGIPAGQEGQELAWVAASELRRFDMPPADAGVVELLVRGGAGFA